MDIEQAETYAALLAERTDARLTLQAFDDTPQRRGELAEVRGGSLRGLADWIAAKQAQGCGVFVTVNATPAGSRKTADVWGVRAVWIDVDGPDPTVPWHQPPSMIVRSGRGMHAYWCLRPWVLVRDCGGPVAFQRAFRDAQKRLVAYYGSDPAVCDLPRVMRLPGTLHQKGEPVPVRLAEAWGAVYSPDEALDGLPLLPRPVRSQPARLTVPGGELDVATLDIVALVRDAGLDPRPAGVGPHGDAAWAIECPWRGEHTMGLQGATSTMVWERGEGRLPGFTCLHAHCEGRRLRDLLTRLGVRLASQYAQTRMTQRARLAQERAFTAEKGMPWTR